GKKCAVDSSQRGIGISGPVKLFVTSLRQTSQAIPLAFQLRITGHTRSDRFPGGNAAVRIVSAKCMVGHAGCVLHEAHLQRGPFPDYFRRVRVWLVALAGLMIKDIIELVT